MLLWILYMFSTMLSFVTCVGSSYTQMSSFSPVIFCLTVSVHIHKHFCLWLFNVLPNEIRCYICNVFFHWLSPCSAIDRKWAQAVIPLKSPQCCNICPKCQPNVRLRKCASHLRHWLCAGIVLTLTACFRDHDDVTEITLTHVIQNPKAKYQVLYWHHCYDAGC